MKTCILFPGQGAQSIGMGKDLYHSDRGVRHLFEIASDSAKKDMAALIFNGTEDELKQTRNAQLALALVDYAVAYYLAGQGFAISGAAGFSLGEWAALCEAGVISFDTMITLVSERGRLMDKAGELSGGSSMSAVLGLEPSKIEEALNNANIKDVWIANYNAPNQSVVSGTEAGLAKAEEAVKAAGAKRAVRLKVSGAFHSPIMQYAYDGFKEILEPIQFNNPNKAFYSNVTGNLVTSGAELKDLAAKQIISPVQWINEQQAIIKGNYEQIIEAGPGSVLAGLWKSTGSSIQVQSVLSLEQITSLLDDYEGRKSA